MNAVIIFLIAVMSGLGVGSGGLLVIFLTSYLHFAPAEARVTNLLFFIISSLGALIIHSFKGRIKYKLVFFAALFGIIGTLFGTSVGKILGDTVLKFIFGILLVISGGYVIFGKKITKTARALGLFGNKNRKISSKPPSKNHTR